jgi:hypothetical protein
VHRSKSEPLKSGPVKKARGRSAHLRAVCTPTKEPGDRSGESAHHDSPTRRVGPHSGNSSPGSVGAFLQAPQKERPAEAKQGSRAMIFCQLKRDSLSHCKPLNPQPLSSFHRTRVLPPPPRLSVSLSFPAEMSVASAQIMASFVNLLLDQAEQQAKLRESGKKDEAAN